MKSWHEAIIKVLEESSEALHYNEITEQILSRGYHKSEGATPNNTVNAAIRSSINKDGDKSPFISVGKGTFALRSATTISDTPLEKEVTSKGEDDNPSGIRAFGVYWRRDSIVWRPEPCMYGKQHIKSPLVDFGKQKGIYILYDHHTPVYVGRSIDRPLGKRLWEHTNDRLNSRWNRFSWFGMLDVTQEGKLEEVSANPSISSLIATLESLLIETLEPPQNRKRGDDFSAIEYIQGVDPKMEEIQIQNTLRSIEKKMRD